MMDLIMEANEKLLERRIPNINEALKFLCEKYLKMIKSKQQKVVNGEDDYPMYGSDEGQDEQMNDEDEANLDIEQQASSWNLDDDDAGDDDYKKIAELTIIQEQIEA